MKNFRVLMLALVLVFSASILSGCIFEKEEVVQEAEFVLSVSEGVATVVAVVSDDDNLVVPSEYEGVPVTKIGEGAFKNNLNLLNYLMV